MRLVTALLGTLLALTACGGGEDDGESRDPSAHHEADVEFTSEMIKHHADALVMVDLTVGKRGLDPQLVDLASTIRTDRALEIETMTDWLQEWNEPIPETNRDHVNAPHEHGGSEDDGHGSEELDELASLNGTEFREAWLEQMIEHHEGSVQVAEQEIVDGSFGPTVALAEKIATAQRADIDRMRALLEAEPAATASSVPRALPKPRRSATWQGIDASHHQGAIDWQAVAGDGIEFAYLKATEGSGFSDDRFESNWADAKRAGLRVGGYHYFTLCAEPEPRAAHYVSRLEAVGYAKADLPPVVDLELIGNCDPPPSRDDMLASARTFIDRVERATGRDVVVYFHPDFESHYGLVDDLGRRLWVRSVGTRAPAGDWFIWQKDDAGSVAGVSGPVDLDVMRR